MCARDSGCLVSHHRQGPESALNVNEHFTQKLTVIFIDSLTSKSFFVWKNVWILAALGWIAYFFL